MRRRLRRGRGRSSAPDRRSRPWSAASARDVQMALKSSTPMRSTTVRTNADPSTYCRVLASMPSSRRSSRSSGLPPRRRREANRLSMTSLLGITDGGDGVHDVLGVALDQRHERGDAVEDGALLGRGQHRQQPGAVALAADDLDQLADRAGQPRAQLGRVGLDGGGQRVDLVEHVLAQPRDGGELHAVGDLVQAHPQPEVVRVDLELALDGDEVRRDEQQLAARAGRRTRTGRAPCRTGSRGRRRPARR